MPAPNASTFDLATPMRPGLQTFNGIAKSDDENEVPDPQTMPNAAEWNTIEWLLLSIGRVMGVAVISVTGSTASINALGSAAKNVSAGTFTMAHPSAGVIEMTVPANTFPTPMCRPNVSLNSGPGSCWAELMTGGVRVHTYDAAGTPADRDFTVVMY